MIGLYVVDSSQFVWSQKVRYFNLSSLQKCEVVSHNQTKCSWDTIVSTSISRKPIVPIPFLLVCFFPPVIQTLDPPSST